MHKGQDQVNMVEVYLSNTPMSVDKECTFLGIACLNQVVVCFL